MIRMEWKRPGMAAVAASLALVSAASGQFPVQDMDSRSMGLGYTFAMRGQNITDVEVASHEVAHQAVLGYAPAPYLSLQMGLGVDRLTVDPHDQVRFKGGYGFSPSFGLSLFSPFFANDVLRGTAGVGVSAFNSEDGRGYRYSAVTSNPFLGLIVSPTVFLDAALGARLHLVDGEMTAPRASGKAFANGNIGRGYLALTLKSPFERAFLHLDLDFSPEVDSDWSAGPREAAVSLSFGTLLGWSGKSRPAAEKPVYFPAYPEMKDRQDKMAEELE